MELFLPFFLTSLGISFGILIPLIIFTIFIWAIFFKQDKEQ
jgi:hypothetical protein